MSAETQYSARITVTCRLLFTFLWCSGRVTAYAEIAAGGLSRTLFCEHPQPEISTKSPSVALLFEFGEVLLCAFSQATAFTVFLKTDSEPVL
jgi:hypothetical protein